MFWIQGPFSTTYAGQPLANKGFFVLQMGIGDRYDGNGFKSWVKAFYSEQEAPFFKAEVESAIDELDRRRLIDRQRVGLSGFSRTVYHTEYLMTHSSLPDWGGRVGRRDQRARQTHTLVDLTRLTSAVHTGSRWVVEVPGSNKSAPLLGARPQ